MPEHPAPLRGSPLMLVGKLSSNEDPSALKRRTRVDRLQGSWWGRDGRSDLLGDIDQGLRFVISQILSCTKSSILTPNCITGGVVVLTDLATIFARLAMNCSKNGCVTSAFCACISCFSVDVTIPDCASMQSYTVFSRGEFDQQLRRASRENPR